MRLPAAFVRGWEDAGWQPNLRDHFLPSREEPETRPGHASDNNKAPEAAYNAASR